MAYTRVNWEDGSTSHNTPISAENLNKMDAGIKELDTNKTDKSGGDFTGDISVNLSGDASKPYIKTDYENGALELNDKNGFYTDYKIAKIVRTAMANTYEYKYPDKSGTFAITDSDGNTDLGTNTIDSGVLRSVAEGYSNTLDDNWTDGCHVEGFNNVVSGSMSHAEGSNNSVTESYSHVEGNGNTVSAEKAHAEGYNNTVSALYGHAEGGSNTASGTASHAEGTNNTASGARAHAEGGGTESTADSSHAEGANTDAYGIASHAEGGNKNADGSSISNERTVTIGSETVSVLGPKAVGVASHAEGVRTLAYGYASHASGIDTDATGKASYTEGYETKASGNYSHAEGSITSASGSNAHAEGTVTLASGDYSHAEGGATTASGSNAHAEGSNTTAGGNYSHAQNNHTVAGYANQTAMGSFNDNKSTNLLEVGNGTDDDNRSNAMEVTADGDLLIKNGGVSLYGLDENKEVLGAKNLLPLTLENLKAINTAGTWSGNAYTSTGVRFDINLDSKGNIISIGATRISANNNNAILYLGDISPGAYKISGTSNGSTSTYYILDGRGQIENYNGDSDLTVASVRGIFIRIISDYQADNVIFYPMARLATDSNPTYQPYAMSNQELTQRLLALEARLS